MRPRQTYSRLAPPEQLQEAQREQLEREQLQRLKPFGWPTDVITRDAGLYFGSMARVDPSGGALTLILPTIAKMEDVGGALTVVNVTGSSNAITVRPADGDATIEGESSIVLGVPYHGPTEFVAADWRTGARLWMVRTLEVPVWEDHRVPLTSGRTGASNPPTLAQAFDDGAGSVGVFAWSFADEAVAGNEDQLWFAVQLPHAYKLGSNLKPHLHWTPAVGGAANEFVKWGLEYTIVDIGGAFPNTAIITTDASTAAAATVQGDTTLVVGKHYMSEFADIDGSGITGVSAMLLCRLFRNSSHADDDLAQAAFAFEFDFHYQADAMGSRLAGTK